MKAYLNIIKHEEAGLFSVVRLLIFSCAWGTLHSYIIGDCRVKNKHLYPNNWEELSWACRERANWQCQICGIANRASRISNKGKPYRVTLQACHKDHSERLNPRAALLCLCEICHWWYDYEHHQLEEERRLFVLQMRCTRLFKMFSRKARSCASGPDRSIVSNDSAPAPELASRFSSNESYSLGLLRFERLSK